MEIPLAYATLSRLEGEDIILAPNVQRPAVYFQGRVADPLLARDALLCLHDTIISDFDTRLTEAELAMRLDPIATVAEDGLFFEAFSQDGSSYGRLAFKPELMMATEAWQAGTTNVDFTDRLATVISAMRSNSPAGFVIDGQGFEVRTGASAVREKKVNVPDAWLRGFASVQAAMTLINSRVEISRADLRNILAFLKTHVERDGPRALVLRLDPNRDVEVMFEPWGYTLALKGAKYFGSDKKNVRLWGRRRLTLLERLMPRLRKITIHSVGSGLPSYWVCDMGPAVYTLGLSGWTIRPFTSSALHLAGPRERVGSPVLETIGQALRARPKATLDDLVQSANVAPPVAVTALSLLCEQGQCMFDLEFGCYRLRQALPVPIAELNAEPDHKLEEEAEDLLRAGAVSVSRVDEDIDSTTVHGSVSGTKGAYKTVLTIDDAGRIVDGECACAWFRYNRLYAGPCKHLLALRMHRAGAESIAE